MSNLENRIQALEQNESMEDPTAPLSDEEVAKLMANLEQIVTFTPPSRMNNGIGQIGDREMAQMLLDGYKRERGEPVTDWDSRADGWVMVYWQHGESDPGPGWKFLDRVPRPPLDGEFRKANARYLIQRRDDNTSVRYIADEPTDEFDARVLIQTPWDWLEYAHTHYGSVQPTRAKIIANAKRVLAEGKIQFTELEKKRAKEIIGTWESLQSNSGGNNA